MSQRFLALAFSLLALPALAEPADPPGSTKPVAEQNLDAAGYIKVHEQGIAKVDVQNANLGVSVTNVPGVTVTNTPNVVVQSLPSVTIGAMPSVAVSSLPAVTIGNSQLDVQVTNTVPVNGTVSISNFPPPQATGRMPTIERLFSTNVLLEPDQETTLPIITMNAVAIEITAFDNSFHATVDGPLGEIVSISDGHANMATDPFYRTFVYPVPVSSVTLRCSNISDNCVFGVTVMGF